ncbi:MAG TPA: 30S ribosomal protein S6 [Bacteroidota bacterium]|nr:30S ribosomal protein S6 [Bacteroidota bacterium]
MLHTKHSYETTFIVNASLEDPQIDAVINHIQEIITRNGGEVQALNKWGRKRLAYTIRKRNNGFYTNVEFTGPGSIIPQLERSYQLDENILRFLTIHRDKRALVAAKPAVAAVAEPVPVPAPTPAPAPAPAGREPLFGDDVAAPKA